MAILFLRRTARALRQIDTATSRRRTPELVVGLIRGDGFAHPPKRNPKKPPLSPVRVNAGKTISQKKGELGPPASSPVSSCSFSLWSARDSLVSRFSERGECRAIANHPLINFAALRKRLAGEVRCLRSALRAYAGRESRRKTGNTARRGTDRRYPNPPTNQSGCAVQGASSI